MTIRRCLAAILITLTAAIWFPIPAKADPVINYAAYNAAAICNTLDSYPSLVGVDGVLQGIQDDSGFTMAESAQVLVLAVNNRCPRHIPLLRRYVATYAPAPKGRLA